MEGYVNIATKLNGITYHSWVQVERFNGDRVSAKRLARISLGHEAETYWKKDPAPKGYYTVSTVTLNGDEASRYSRFDVSNGNLEFQITVEEKKR